MKIKKIIVIIITIPVYFIFTIIKQELLHIIFERINMY